MAEACKIKHERMMRFKALLNKEHQAKRAARAAVNGVLDM